MKIQNPKSKTGAQNKKFCARPSTQMCALVQNKKQGGQVLLITVLILFSTFALAIALGGMVLFELRSMISTGESVKALYAAESGIEWEIYRTNRGNIAAPAMTNGTEYQTSSGAGYLRSVGKSGKVNRALEITF